MTEVWVERRKWPDLPHYRHTGVVLGEDGDGLWISLPPGRPIYRGDEVLFYGEGQGLMLAPPHGRWLAWWPVHRDFELYVDIVREMSITPEGVVMVDMDLDVVRWHDGRVELLDEDELELHETKYGYTAAMVEDAVRTGAEVLDAVRDGVPPFDGAAAARWMSTISSA